MSTEYPRIAIEFCTACKWNLRAAWYLQELLSTFGETLGEVALIPRTGGTFIVTVTKDRETQGQVIWDRTVEGGFPDSKQLKRLVRDIVKPQQGLGHVDRVKAVEGLVSKTTENQQVEDGSSPSSSTVVAGTTEESKEDSEQHQQSEIGEACPDIN